MASASPGVLEDRLPPTPSPSRSSASTSAWSSASSPSWQSPSPPWQHCCSPPGVRPLPPILHPCCRPAARRHLHQVVDRTGVRPVGLATRPTTHPPRKEPLRARKAGTPLHSPRAEGRYSHHIGSPRFRSRSREAVRPIVVCVDDDRSNLDALARVLRARRTVLLASTRRRARRSRQGPPRQSACVLADLRLPGLPAPS